MTPWKWQINSEEVNESEIEWLMEEIATPNQKLENEGKENGHVAGKAVKSETLPSLHVDDLDSEDEVLTVPEVKIHSAKTFQSSGSHRSVPQQKADDRAVLLNGGKNSKGNSAFGQRKLQNLTNTSSFHDDSDEDLLNV